MQTKNILQEKILLEDYCNQSFKKFQFHSNENVSTQKIS